MKKQSIFLLAGLLSVSVAGMATASAFIIKDAVAQSATVQVDEVAVLAWGETAQFVDIENLSPTSTKYAAISVTAPVFSSGAGEIAGKFTLKLENNAGSSIDGLRIDIATTTWQVATAPTPVATLDSTTAEYVDSNITGAKTYHLRFTISETAYDTYIADGATSTFGGKLTATYGINN